MKFSVLHSIVFVLMCLAVTANPPSVVVILVDDWGYGDLGANGFGAETPNLDALAAGGIRFVDMHSNSVCTPSRASLQSGRYNIRAGVDGNFDVDSKAGLALAENTIADILKGAATPYKTKIIGKWHLGHQPGYHPTWRGYDSYGARDPKTV
jgi:arylsulfatase A-like enzyme